MATVRNNGEILGLVGVLGFFVASKICKYTGQFLMPGDVSGIGWGSLALVV